MPTHELFVDPSATAARPLRPYQQRAIDGVAASIRAGRHRPILELATGAGKGQIVAEIIKRARAKQKHVAVIVPTLSLIGQTVDVLEAEGIDCIGVIQADHQRTDASLPIQVISVQTLARRQPPDADIVLIDECHLVFKAVVEWMAARPDLVFIGFSATPWTRGLGRHYDALVAVETMANLIAQRILCPMLVFAPSAPDLEGVRTFAGDFSEAELAERCNTARLVGDVVATWRERGDGRPTSCATASTARTRYTYSKDSPRRASRPPISILQPRTQSASAHFASSVPAKLR